MSWPAEANKFIL